jgi:hypothetical protein
MLNSSQFIFDVYMLHSIEIYVQTVLTSQNLKVKAVQEVSANAWMFSDIWHTLPTKTLYFDTHSI